MRFLVRQRKHRTRNVGCVGSLGSSAYHARYDKHSTIGQQPLRPVRKQDPAINPRVVVAVAHAATYNAQNAVCLHMHSHQGMGPVSGGVQSDACW